jgi:hypothetical protein
MAFGRVTELFDRVASLAEINYVIGMRSGIETALADPERAKKILAMCIAIQPEIDSFLKDFEQLNHDNEDMADFLAWKRGEITEETFRERQKARNV